MRIEEDNIEEPEEGNDEDESSEEVEAEEDTGFSRTSNTTASYQVYHNSGGGCTIGYCVRTEAQARTVRVLIRTKYGHGGVIGNEV